MVSQNALVPAFASRNPRATATLMATVIATTTAQLRIGRHSNRLECRPMRNWAVVVAITVAISVAVALGFREANAGTSAFWLTIVGAYAVITFAVVGWAVLTRDWD